MAFWRSVMLDSKSNSPCAIILTALPVEYQAVRSHLIDLHEDVHPRGTIYERGIFFSSSKQSWDIGIVEIGKGNVNAARESERAITYFQPSIVLFVGVAGGLKDVQLGDVVAAVKVYGYEAGKVTTTFQTRPNVVNVTYHLEQRIRAEARKPDWLQRISKPFPERLPRVFVAPIAAGEKVLAPDQFRYIHEKYDDLTQRSTSREGERRFALRYRAILGESTHMADGPGSLCQGDATIGDIHLVSSRDRSRLIGRPVIYIIIDVFTRLIVGFSVSLEGPSWVGMMLALYNATVDKVAYCKEYGIDITQDMWPSYGLPEAILGDRGELEGYDSTNLVDSLDIDVANTSPYRCDWKAICEHNFRIISDDVIHWKPGAVYTKRERGDDDYRLEACLTLPEFREMMIRCILKHNNHDRMDWYDLDEFMITDHVEPYTIELWNWGVTHRTGHLRKKEDEVIQFKLLPREPGSVTEFGIYFKGAHYTCERAIKEQWFVKARNRGRKPVTVAYDPRKLDTIYLLDKEGKPLNKEGKPEACELVERERGKYQGRDWFEILDYFELQKQAEEASRLRQYQAEAEFNAQIDSIVKHAQEKTAQATKGMSKAAHLSNMQGNRQDERDDEAARDAWTPGKERAGSSRSDTRAPEGQVEEAESSYVPPDQPLDTIRRLR